MEPKTNPPIRFAPLKTGMAFFELISGHGRDAPLRRPRCTCPWTVGGRRSAPSLPQENLTLAARRCHDSFRKTSTEGKEMASQFFRTKSPDHLMREAAAPERQM